MVGQLVVAALALCAVAPARAGLLSSCTLTLSSSGKLVMSADGQTMGSQVTGGSSAVMAVVGVNLTPQLIFSSLSVVGPTGWNSVPVTYLSARSLSGATQAYTTQSFTFTPGILIDTLTLDAKIVSIAGFKAGTYTASSTLTCQAA